MPDRGKRKRPANYMSDTGPTPKRGWGGSGSVGDYGTAAAPRVGGSAQSPSSPGFKGANSSQMRRASRLRRKMGTGNMASRSARRSSRRAGY